jgi:hypothetical protein
VSSCFVPSAECAERRVLSSPYRGGQTRDWLKTKCHPVDRFAITEELSEGRLEE